MKTEFQDVSETQKTITIEIPSDVVDAEIDRIVKGYSKQAGCPASARARCPRRSSSSGFANRFTTT
jgi:hypothetical protein